MGIDELYVDYQEDETFRDTGLHKKKSVFVPGRGSRTPKVMLVGPAPSALDTAEKRCFSGLPGVCLESLMALAGLRLGWVGKQTGLRVPPECAEGLPPNAFLTLLVKYRHPKSGRPTLADEITSLDYLRQEWSLLGGPRVIVAIGDTVWKHLGPPVASSIHWSVGQEYLMKGNVSLWPMYHPNYGIKHAEMQEKMEEHWERFGAALREDGVL